MLKSKFFRFSLRYTFSIILLSVLIACNPEELSNLFSNTLSGSVGDGPITQAQISVTDANSAIVGAAISDSTANYTLSVPTGTAYPILVSATSGTDVVTGTDPDFSLLSVAVDPTVRTVNINPFTTLIVKSAQVMSGGLTAENIQIATQNVMNHLNFGLDSALVPNPITTSINEANVAAIIKASEAMGETIRRTQSALLLAGVDISADDIVTAIAADIADGVLDGRGVGADSKIAATANIVSSQVLVEALINHLNVGDLDSTERMDFAITISIPSATMKTADVMITYRMLNQSRIALEAARAFAPSSNLSAIAVVLAGLSGNAVATTIEAALPVNPSSSFSEVLALLPAATNNELETINSVVRVGDTGSAPTPDPMPSSGYFEFNSSTYTTSENAGSVDIVVNRVGDSTGVGTVEIRTITLDVYGTADWQTDYASVNWKPLTFADGVTTKTENISINSDAFVEGDETFSVLLRVPAGSSSALAGITTALVTIQDSTTPTAAPPAPEPTPPPAPEPTPPPVPEPTPPPAPTPAPTDRGYENLLNEIEGFGASTTGGKGGQLCRVTTLANTGSGSLRACAESTGAKWIIFDVSGTIDLAASEIRTKPDKTIDGRGADITISNGGIRIDNTAGNVIINNIKFTNQFVNASGSGTPYVNILRDTSRIWVHHVTFENAEDDAIQAGNYTLVDRSPREITVSWCRWNNLKKAFIVGFNPKFLKDEEITVTMHHNFFNDTIGRHPRLRFGKVHAYNNYMYHWHGVNASVIASQGGELVSENNVYESGANSGLNLGSGSTLALVATAQGDDPEPGFARSTGDVLLGASKTENLPQNVFIPSSIYNYTLDDVSDGGKTLIANIKNRAGWQNSPLP